MLERLGEGNFWCCCMLSHWSNSSTHRVWSAGGCRGVPGAALRGCKSVRHPWREGYYHVRDRDRHLPFHINLTFMQRSVIDDSSDSYQSRRLVAANGFHSVLSAFLPLITDFFHLHLKLKCLYLRRPKDMELARRLVGANSPY